MIDYIETPQYRCFLLVANEQDFNEAKKLCYPVGRYNYSGPGIYENYDDILVRVTKPDEYKERFAKILEWLKRS